MMVRAVKGEATSRQSQAAKVRILSVRTRVFPDRFEGSGEDLVDWAVAFFDQMEIAAQGAELHFLVIEPELFEDGRVKVAVIVGTLDGFVAIFVSGSVDGAALRAVIWE